MLLSNLQTLSWILSFVPITFLIAEEIQDDACRVFICISVDSGILIDLINDHLLSSLSILVLKLSQIWTVVAPTNCLFWPLNYLHYLLNTSLLSGSIRCFGSTLYFSSLGTSHFSKELSGHMRY